MHTTRLASIACGLALVAVLATWVATPTASNREVAASLPSGNFAIRDVRVFDGERVLERATVVVRSGRVVSRGAGVAPDSSLPVVDGKGMTLLPGLIDAHVHAFGEARRDALRAGVTTMVDLFRDAPADEQFVELVKHRRGFVVATLAVIAGIENLARERRNGENASREPTLLRDAGTSVRLLQAAGVPILAGSDAPNFGLAHGAALHAELDQLVAAGLTPVQALVAATSAPAVAFDIPERGRIAPGMRADLLLVRGDPTTDIKATRDIVAVWKNGFAVDRAEAGGTRVPDLKGQAISDFELDAKSRYGSGWTASADRVMGGKSEAKIARVASGAHDSAGALRVEGNIAAGFAYPWAGAMFSPGPAPMRTVDYSGHRELRFKVRGDGRSLQAMLLTGSVDGGVPPSREFETGPEWREVRLPLDSFARADLARVWGIGFNASSTAGTFWFELDDVFVE